MAARHHVPALPGVGRPSSEGHRTCGAVVETAWSVGMKLNMFSGAGAGAGTSAGTVARPVPGPVPPSAGGTGASVFGVAGTPPVVVSPVLGTKPEVWPPVTMPPVAALLLVGGGSALDCSPRPDAPTLDAMAVFCTWRSMRPAPTLGAASTASASSARAAAPPRNSLKSMLSVCMSFGLCMCQLFYSEHHCLEVAEGALRGLWLHHVDRSVGLQLADFLGSMLNICTKWCMHMLPQ